MHGGTIVWMRVVVAHEVMGNVRFSGSVEEVKQNPKIVDEACF
jgi:hypothetical protein